MRGAKVGRRALYVEISVVVTREIVALLSPVQLWYLNPYADVVQPGQNTSLLSPESWVQIPSSVPICPGSLME